MMRRIATALLAILCFVVSATALGQTVGNQTAAANPASVRRADTVETTRADRAEHSLAVESAIRQIQAAQTSRNDSILAIVVGVVGLGFGGLVTGIAIFFSFQSQRVAGAEAAKAAREEMAAAEKHIERLRDEATRATEQANLATEAANAAALRAADAEAKAVVALAKAEAAAAGAQSQHDSAAASALAIAEKQREAAAIVDSVKASSTGNANPTLTPDQEEKIVSAAQTNAAIEEAQWSPDQFKTAIGKAMYVDKNWDEALRLASAMEEVHGTDEDARLYALGRRGDVARELGRYDDARQAYEAAIVITTPDPPTHRQYDYFWASYHLGVCLTYAGRAPEAESILRDLMSFSKNIYGAKASDTLVTRHELARAILDQGRAAEAEAMLRDLLPMKEKIDGVEASGTLVTRHELARATLDLGRAAEAEAMLRDLLPICERIDGAEASGTLVTRHELARAILDQGRAAEAEKMLRDLLPMKERIDGAEASGMLVTRHLLTRAIRDQGRAAEAEAMLRDLLPICERVDGPEASGTLVTRHELARAILDQDRPAEAEAIQRDLLPISERIDGETASGTLVTRYNWADALVQSGDLDGARAALAPIPDPVPNSNWSPRYEAALAFVRGRVADASGDTVAADIHLVHAAETYAAIYPENHSVRQKLKAYMANRPTGKAADA